MGFLDQVRVWFHREAGEARRTVKNLEHDLDRDLTERERRLNETPSEAVERIQREIADQESSFDAVRDRIGTTSSLADARAELAEDDSDPDDLDRG